jgi:hypothetical protein
MSAAIYKPLAALAAGLMLVLAAQSASAQTTAPTQTAPAPTIAGLDGDWYGVLDNGPGKKLRAAVHFKTDAHGTTGTADSIDEHILGMPVSDISRDGPKVRFEVEAFNGVYVGVLDASGQTLIGQWGQDGIPQPLNLTRKAAGAGGSR